MPETSPPFILGAALAVLAASAATAAANPDLKRGPEAPGAVEPVTQFRAVRISSPIEIDGQLAEAAWQAPANQGLIQNEPDNGKSPIFPTDWWIGYDDHALYAAFRCHDPAPDSIDAAVARRDASLNTDEVFLQLDTYNDDRNGYLFVISAGGYLFDAAMYNDGAYDNSWDAVYWAASRVNDDGWTAELKIPFSQLRFPPVSEQVWGVNVVRHCKRYQSEDLLFHRPREESGDISRFPDLVGIRGIEAGPNREGLVYGVGKGEYLQTQTGNPFNDGSELAYDVGGDVKWGLSSNLTLDATINPDFGQVEVDPAVVNLTDFETFYPEKRPFFVQDANVFQFGRDGTNSNWNYNWMDPLLLYSRRVGRAPQLGVSGAAEFAESPGVTTILGAGKLSGTLGRTSLGALTAFTAREYHEVVSGDAFSRELAEPFTNYTVLRGTRTSSDATHALGFAFTGTHRDLSDEQSRESLSRQAYSGGVDGWTLLDDNGTWALRGYLAGSLVRGEPAAMERLQRSSRRYMQRPDADHLDLDPGRTALAGWTSRVMLNKQKGDYFLNNALGAISPGFEINDLGFQSRADYVNYHLAAGRNWQNPGRVFRNREVNLSSYWTWDFGGNRTGGGMGAGFWAQFLNYWSINGGGFFNPRRNDNRITRGGPLMRLPVNREFNFGIRSDSRKSWQVAANGGASWGDPGEAYAWGNVGFEIKPSPALNVSLEPGYTWEHAGSQYVTTRSDPAMTSTFGNRYIFADLEYTEVNLSARVDWSFTPRLTLQTYVQPLIAVGDYRGIKEFAEPRTYDFNVYGESPGSSITRDDATGQYEIDPGDGGDAFTLRDPDFNFKSLRVNAVLRWEYNPGSAFYLVWTRNGTAFENPGRFDLGTDLGDLADAPGDDVVMMKVTRWFDF